jgi:D-alanine-D-alanine ligase
MKRLRVAVLYGGISAEHEISVISARSILAAIDRDKYDVLPIAITKRGRWLLPDRPPDQLPQAAGALSSVGEDQGTAIVLERGGALAGKGVNASPVDVAFPVLHGPGGEDGTIQGLLETLGVPYVGAGVAASAVGMDKSLQKPVFAGARIPVTPWMTIRKLEMTSGTRGVVRSAIETIGLPCFTKPANLGSSVGVAKCQTAEELAAGLTDAFRYDDTVLVEQAVEGQELECAVLGNDEPEASVVGEVVPVNEFYDYEAKYLVEGSELIIPADIPEDVAEDIRRYAVRAFTTIGCAGMARVDFFYAAGRVLLSEINTIPGFTPISMYPKLWEASGIPYAKLIDRLIELALERSRARRGA